MGTTFGCKVAECGVLHANSFDFRLLCWHALLAVKKLQLMMNNLLVCTKLETSTADVFSRSHWVHDTCVSTAFWCTGAECGVLHADSLDFRLLCRQ